MHELWLARNAVVHKANAAGISTRVHAQATNEVTQLYALQIHCDSSDQRMLAMPLEDRLAQPTRDLQAWATSKREAIWAAVKSAQHRAKHRWQDIRNFFTPKPTATPPVSHHQTN
ncbi:hypothetical protein ACA910_015015 [Epithemia clementina (nom. ined.)]